MNELWHFIQQNWKDLTALFWFLICFRGYTIYSARAAKNTHCLASVMHRYRIEWMKGVLVRDMRIADTTTISNLERKVTFFASTTLLIMAGIVTVLGSTEKAIDVISDIPFASQATTAEWELKLVLLIAMFSYAFFKFTGSLRQYGFVSVMIGGTPMPDEPTTEQAKVSYALRNASILSLAAENFNSGLRTYYFSIAVLTWFINTWLFMAMSIVMVGLLYRREFKSRTLCELMVSRSEEED